MVLDHPLDPLSPIEISKTSMIIKASRYPLGNVGEKGLIFNSITLLEPPKEKLAPALLTKNHLELSQGSFPRKSFSVLISRDTGVVSEVIVDLSKGKVESDRTAERGFQPTLSPEDCFKAEKIFRASVQVRKRCEKLGIVNMDLVTPDPWSVGYNGESEFEGRRLMQLFAYTRNYPGDNHYAHPLDFVVVVDLFTDEVVRIEDIPVHSDFHPRNGEEVEIPKGEGNYDPDLLPKDFMRKDLKPLQILQPEGPSFAIHGNLIQWQKFQMRISFNYREGLVLHDVRYQDGATNRPLFYRLSLSELVVPYGDPRPPFHRKCAFDVGDYGLGFSVNSLSLGCDCLGTIKYFDAVLNSHDGEPSITKNAICLHEEDAGTLHKHTESRTRKAVVTRSRKLVISFVVTVGNYEYAFYWSFFQDGTIKFEVKATGELSTHLIATGEDPSAHGTIVFPNVNAQYHQHIFCMRIDPMIDGLLNSVSVADVRALEGSQGNPYGQGFTVVEQRFNSSKGAVSDIQSSSSRSWKIQNPGSIHPYTGKPVAWKLVPSSNALPGIFAGPESFIRKRAGFATHSVWVTQHRDDELFAAGFYTNQSKGGDGLSEWIKRDEKIDNQDIVLWHSFGVTHIPRVEDFPIMPVEQTGFTLKPCNFFTGNPGIDVPPSNVDADHKSKLAEDCLGCNFTETNLIPVIPPKGCLRVLNNFRMGGL